MATCGFPVTRMADRLHELFRSWGWFRMIVPGWAAVPAMDTLARQAGGVVGLQIIPDGRRRSIGRVFGCAQAECQKRSMPNADTAGRKRCFFSFPALLLFVPLPLRLRTSQSSSAPLLDGLTSTVRTYTGSFAEANVPTWSTTTSAEASGSWLPPCGSHSLAVSVSILSCRDPEPGSFDNQDDNL